MSTRSNASYNYRNRNYTDPTPLRSHTKYNQRGGPKNYRPEPNRRQINGNDLDTLMVSIDRHLTTDGNSIQELLSTGRTVNRTKGQRQLNKKNNSSIPQIAWWRVTIQKAGTIGKERVMAALQARSLRPFQPYHVNIYLFKKKTQIFILFVYLVFY